MGIRARQSAPKAWIGAMGLWLTGMWASQAMGAPQGEPKQDVAKMSIEELMQVKVDTVYGASKFEQKVTQAPSYVSIVTAEEIAKYGYRTMGELLASVPGFYLRNDRNYTYLGVRGFGRPGDFNDRILLLVDGHRLNEDVYESMGVEMRFPIDVDLIEKVEVIRGPGSALYGTDAFFAVINVITKRGRALQGAEVSASAASLQTFATRATYGTKAQSGPEILLSGTFYHSLGNHSLYYPEFNAPATNNGYAVGLDGEQARSFFAGVQYGDFALEGAYARRDKVIPTASFDTVFNDPRTRTTDSSGYFDVKYTRTVADKWEIVGRLGFDRYFYHGVYVMDYAGTGEPPYTLNEDYAEGQWLTLAVDVSRSLWEKHRVTFGTENRWNIQQKQWNYDLTPYAPYLNDSRNSTVTSFYAEDVFAIRRDLMLSAGGRVDHYSAVGASANPRLGLIYSPWERTNFKVLYGQAFRAPNVYEMYYTDGFTQEINPRLQPETIKTTELVFEQYLNKNAYVTISGFYNAIRGLITQEVDPAKGMIQFVNLENVRGKGVDFEIGRKWAGGWEARMAYTVQDTRDEPSGSLLNNSPEHLPKINLMAPVIPGRLFAAFQGQYVSQRETSAGSTAGGFFTANATVSAPALWKGLSLSASAYNVFDKRYADPGAGEHRQQTIPQDGRILRLKATYRF